MKKIAVLGASYLQKPLVEKAKQMGIETHCFAWDTELSVCKYISDYFYPISVIEKEEILKKCQEIKIDGITTIATDICIPTISYVAEKMNLVSNSIHTSYVTTNKYEMKKVFASNNIKTPNYVVINKNENINFDEFNFPLICKPVDSSGSKGVSIINGKSSYKKSIEYAFYESKLKVVIIEEFIDGKEISIECISIDGEHYILALTDKVTNGKPNFVEIEHHQPAELSTELRFTIEEITVQVLNAVDIKYGASHLELIINEKDEIYVIEIGSRMGGDFIGSHLTEISTGYDYLKGVIEIAVGIFNIPKITNNGDFCGVYFLSEETKRIKKYFNSFNNFDLKKEIFNDDLKFLNDSSDRSGFIIYKSNKKIIL